MLASWHDGAARAEIVGYLERVTAEGGPEHVPPAERIAVVDNDGTLWCEKPAYVQAFFVLERLHEQAAVDPELAARDVVKALLANDLAAANKEGPAAVMAVLLDTFAGLTTDEFEAAVADWLARFRHPRFRVPFADIVYAPMLELLDLLREHEFRVFLVTGGGADCLRPVASQLYGVEPDDIIGSAVEVSSSAATGASCCRTAAIAGLPNEGPSMRTHAHIGRRPIVAVGNSAGDREMLEFAHTGARPSLCVVVNHDDEEREYAYSGEALTNPDAEPILATAQRFGWTVVSMRDDWSRVFA
jgi:phosphoserine phosphatase